MLQDTSLTAYAEVIRPKLRTLEAEIRRILRDHPEGMTDQEIGKLMGLVPSSVSGVRNPMVHKLKQVYEAGERKCTITGNKAKVWKLVQPPEPAPKPEHKPISLFDGVSQDSNDI